MSGAAPTHAPRIAAPADRGRRRPDPRLPAYLVAGLGALIVAVATGRYEVAALGAPFVLLLAVGVAPRPPVRARGQVRMATARVMEGDEFAGEVLLDWDGEAEIDVALAGWRGVTPVEPLPAPVWALPAVRGPVRLEFRLRATSWGVHDLGDVWVRVRRPGGFVFQEYRVARAPTLRVLPTALRLSRLLHPSEPRAIAGMHPTRFRGAGTDFAELRPYQPGDRLRDLSWATSARLGAPWVRVSHPERTGTVLLALDAVFGEEVESMEALARAARTAWTVASAHLRAQDRVGLLAQGRTAAWLPPRGGRRARWMLLDELLSVGRAAEDTSRRRQHRRRVVVPSDALVVGVSSLRSDTFVTDLIHYRRAGHTTVALVIDTTDLQPPAAAPEDQVAQRLRSAQRAAERRALEQGGVPTAVVTDTGDVGAAILALRRRVQVRRSAAPAGVGAS
ncbi:MAG: DUF58 domain-containing protein [Longimicrobiales bacterium]